MHQFKVQIFASGRHCVAVDKPLTTPLFFGVVVVIWIVLSTFTGTAHAWSNDPAQNTSIATLTGYQGEPDILHDGAGGVFIAWSDNRDGGASSDIYAQHLDRNGKALWAANGIKVAGSSGNIPRMVTDGAGGVIIVWDDSRDATSFYYGQRLNAAGVAQWAANGVAIEALPLPKTSHRLVSDGAGGAIIVWEYHYSTGDYDIYAQKINGAGVRKWGNTGVGISTLSSSQYGPRLISDGAGGAFIVWEDERGGDLDIYAQHILHDKSFAWAKDGEVIDDNPEIQYAPRIISDGKTGIIVSYLRTDAARISIKAYAQRVTGLANGQWANGPIAISIKHERRGLEIVPDGAGGLIASWWQRDSQGVNPTAIYAQRLNASGAQQWSADGVRISYTDPNLLNPDSLLVQEANEGAVIAWFRGDVFTTYDLLGNKVGLAGQLGWGTGGVLISNNIQLKNTSVAEDKAGGAIFAITAQRDPARGNDIYAQKVDKNGKLRDDNLCFPIKSAAGTVGIICL